MNEVQLFGANYDGALDPTYEDGLCPKCGNEADWCTCGMCRYCDGDGRVPSNDYEAAEGIMFTTCRRCGGSGRAN